MPTKTDRILSYLPGTYQTSPRPPVLYPVADTFGNELLLAENSLSAVMLAHWVDFADKGTEAIDDLARIASLYGLAPRQALQTGLDGSESARSASLYGLAPRYDETVEEFREHLKHYVRTFLDGTVTVQGILRVAAEVLGLRIADSYDDLDSWWQRRDVELVTVEPRGDDAANLLFGVPALKVTGNAAQPAQVRGKVPLTGVKLKDPSIFRLRVDGGNAKDVSLPSGPVNPVEIEKAINTAMGQTVARIDGSFLILTSPTVGPSSRLEVLTGPNDAAGEILGLAPRIYQGSDAVGAQITGKANLSSGADLSKKRYLRLAVDGTHLAEVDCADPNAASTTSLDHIRDAINSALGINVASHDGSYLTLRSLTQGFRSSIALQPATAQDAMAILFGPVEPLQTGHDAQPARAIGSRDLRQGVDLSRASNIRLRIDGTSHTIDCAGFNPAQTQTLEIVTAINAAFGAQVASPDGAGIALTSRTVGPAGEVAFESPPSGDATETILGIGPRIFQGSDATTARIVGTPDLNPENPLDNHHSVDLTAQHLLSLAIDGGPALKIDLRPQAGDRRAVKPEELAAVINQVTRSGIASTDGHHLMLTSPTSGAASSLEIKPPERTKRRRFVTRALVTDEAAEAVFGFVSKEAHGTAATSAQLIGAPDLSYGIDLRDAPNLRITVDDREPQEINCAGVRPRATQLPDIENAINEKLGKPDVATDDGRHLVLNSPSAGAGSRIVVEPPTVSDPTDALPVLGLLAGAVRGRNATRVTFTGLVDLSTGVDLGTNASIKLRVDGDQHEINLAGAAAAHKSAGEIATLINVAFRSNVCIVGGTRLVLSSSGTGSASQIGFDPPTAPDATAAIFGIAPTRLYQGDDAQPAQVETQEKDLSKKVDLSVARFLRVSVDGGATQDVDCAAQAASPGAATLNEIVSSINNALPGIASASHDGKHLVLTSPTIGFTGNIKLETRRAGDASRKLFGSLDPLAQGKDPAPAVLTGNATLTGPVDLSRRRIIRLSVNGERPVDIDVAGKFPNATSIDEVVASINRVFPGMAAATQDDKLELTAPTALEGSSISLLPLRYLELIEYSPQPMESGPLQLRSGQRWSLTNPGASESSLEIRLTTPVGVVDPALVNLTLGRSVRLRTVLSSGETACLTRNEERGIRVEITSVDGKRRYLPPADILAGTLSSLATVPFKEPQKLTQDAAGQATLQLNNPEAPNVVVLHARQEVPGNKILVTVSESDISNVSVPPAVEPGTVVDRIGRISADAEVFRLLDHTGQPILQLRPGPCVNLNAYRDQAVLVTGPYHPGEPPLMVPHAVARVFDVKLQFTADEGPDINEIYHRVTIGDGPGEDSLVMKINAGTKFGEFSKLVKAEEVDKGEVLIVPQGNSDWIYLECQGSRYDEAKFDEACFPGGFCDQVGVFNISRFAHRSAKRTDPVAPLFGPLSPSPDPTVQVTTRWMNYQPGSFVVNLPDDLDERFGGRFNQARFGQNLDSPEVYPGAVAEPENDATFLKKLIDKKPSRFVTAQKVDRVPLGWSPAPLPFRKPNFLTGGSEADPARIYLTEEGLDGAIELTAKSPGVWGNQIAVRAPKSGPALYDVAIIFEGARFESARQVVGGPLPDLALDLIKPGPIGVLQAKAAGVLAKVTRDRAERTENEGAAPLSAPRSSFTVYDNMFYQQKPDTEQEGLVASDILYEGYIWPHGQNYGVLPTRSAFEAIVHAHSANPGPLVLDIEKLPLKGPPEVARHHMETLAKLADWAHEAAPGKIIGYYGYNTLSQVAPPDLPYARELALHVDAFFPSMYTFDDDQSAWAKRAQAFAAEARALGPGKPVYFYLWPQYHDGTPKQFQFIDGAYWKFQLETAHRYADGVVLWSPSSFTWDDSTGWWTATREFMQTIRYVRVSNAQ